MTKNRKKSTDKVPTAVETKSETRGGEERAAKEEDEKGMHKTGPRGRSGRPAGGRDTDAHTGVDPQ
ncbi:hypothetical protein [Streptomyces lydicus]|uniref:hypothetical protein n=1 Tax=Streptomyces lydicus TaxID=47763 RepID=UPI003715F416